MLDPATMAQATFLLANILHFFGINKDAATIMGGVLTVLALVNGIASLLMLKLPLPVATSARWYVVTYSVIRYAALNLKNATPAAAGAMTVAKVSAPVSDVKA